MKIKEFIPNTPDDSRCLQASYRMMVEALTGVPVSASDAELETGFVEGRPTWQFRTLLGLANRGIQVDDCEKFDPQEFLTDPIRSISQQVGDDEVARQVIAESDIDAELQALTACLQHPLVSFTNEIATLDGAAQEIAQGAVLLCNINVNRLNGRSGRRGHFVITQSITDDEVTITDPGPPPLNENRYARAAFEAAWADPSPAMANFISARVPSTA